MKKAITLVLAIALLASPLTVFSNEYNEIVEDGAAIMHHEYWRSIDAKIDQLVEIGTMMGLPGIYADFYYEIRMTHSDLESISGDYSLDVHSTLSINSDEAADILASSLLGGSGSISGLGLGISAEMTGSYNTFITVEDGEAMWNPEYAMEYVSKIHPNWQSVIKDKDGKIVTPKKGSYMMFADFTLNYESKTSHALFGSFDEFTSMAIFLFVLIDPDPVEGAFDLDDRSVRVYMTFPELTLKGAEVWLEGEGILKISEDSWLDVQD